MAPRIVDKEEKKRQIINSAMSVFAKNGLYNSKMVDIAEAAGIGKGTIYEYFKSKEDIFLEAFEYFMKDMETELAKKLFRITDPAEKIVAIIEVFFGTFESFHDSLFVMFDFWAEGIRKRDKRMEELLKKVYHEEGKEKNIFRDIDSNMIASSIVGAMDGLILQWIIFGHDYNVHHALEEFKNMVLMGIRK
jgi:AcrR family transcriptional regulator